MGVTGLETAFAAIHTELVLPGVIDLALLVERLAGGAAPFGIAPADPGARRRGQRRVVRPRRRVDGRRGRLREPLGELLGRRAQLTGRVLMTVAAGQVAFRLRSFSLGVAP